MYEAGLILEGGGMRGAYTAGVLDCFLDYDIEFKNVYGVSAGVCHACSYLSKQRERAIHVIVDYINDKNYAGLYSLLMTGDFFGVKMIYHDIPKKLYPFDYETYSNCESNLFAVVTNCKTGEAEYHQVRDMDKEINIIQASSSLPLLSKIVEINKEYYLDGGVSDSIPLQKALDDGNKKNLVILTQHQGYEKKPNRLGLIMKYRYTQFPNLVDAIKTRHIRYNDSLALIEQEKDAGSLLIIQPKQPVEIGRIERNKDKLWDLYHQGYEDAKERIVEIKKFLSK